MSSWIIPLVWISLHCFRLQESDSLRVHSYHISRRQPSICILVLELRLPSCHCKREGATNLLSIQ